MLFGLGFFEIFTTNLEHFVIFYGGFWILEAKA